MSSDGSLTPAELEAVALLANSHSNKYIAFVLEISVRTVENRVLLALGKTGTRNRQELAEWYRQTR